MLVIVIGVFIGIYISDIFGWRFFFYGIVFIGVIVFIFNVIVILS